MSHGRGREISYPGPCDPMSRGRSELNPDDDESSVDEGEIPPNSYDEAVIRHEERGEMEPEHVEREEQNPC